MDVIRQVLTVTAVLLLLAAALWWLRRKGLASFAARRTRGRLLQPVERLALGPQHSLHLVRLGRRALLVSASPTGCALVESCAWSELDSPTSGLPESHS